ncbi:MAG TPA: hypothetical protein VM366_20235 [Anaerolineae bacterium]|nr:hypothetical protein [Anaerolineae bacterium]
MITPAGTDCRFYYEDFNRGRQVQECRLVAQNPGSAMWRPRLCQTCPVPAIQRANACPNMALEGWVGRRWLVIPQVKVSAHCTLNDQGVADPMVGCGHCHEMRWQDTIRGKGDAT